MSRKSILQGNSPVLAQEYHSLPEMFLHVAKQYPDKGMFFVETSGKEIFCSYSELVNTALKYLSRLQQLGLKPGNVIILEISEPRLFYPIFLACLLNGVVPAPITKPASFEMGSEKLSKLFKVWEILDKPILLIEEKYRKHYQKLLDEPSAPNFQFFSEVQILGEENGEIHYPKAADLAILQFSSGSTGVAKGVQLTHQNIIANITAIGQRFALTQHDNTFMWIPHTHDMGLFMQYLCSVMHGCNLIIFSPYAFIRSPYIFLKKIGEHKGSWFAAPNFAYDWMTKNIPDNKLASLDLSSLRFTINAAEPISSTVVTQFINKFSVCGFKKEMLCTAYGLAEATVAVTISKIGAGTHFDCVDRLKVINENLAIPIQLTEDPKSKIEFAREGTPIDGFSVRIANDDGDTLPENHIGEIQIQGISVTTGYYKLDAINESLFQKGWLRTGDLGFIHNNELIITGRIKDIIFMRGQNYYSHDLEEIIFKAEYLPRGNIAFVGVFNTQLQQEELLAFIKHKSNIEDLLVLRKNIISALHEALGIPVQHVIPIKDIPKTTSGKIQRFLLRKNYENELYKEIIHEIEEKLLAESDKTSAINVFTTNNLEIVLRKIWSKLLEIPIDKISIHDKFFALGGNSIKAFQLLHEIELYLGKEVDSEILVTCHTIQQLIDYLQNLFLQPSPNPHAASQIQSQLTEQSNEHRSIAITGMALRLPKAKNQEEFWNNLHSGKNCFAPISEKRKELSDEASWNDWIAELDNIEYFDNEFFEISAEEAAFMDPQQRIVLQVAYEALEDAGLISNIHQPANVGVYAGSSANTYYPLLLEHLKKYSINAVHPNALLGNMPNILAAGISREFNLVGPALVIDTACSSFMAALHHAVEALRKNQVAGAVVIGANILATSALYTLSRQAGIISKHAHPKVFDQAADGTILGEGVVVFYLEKLSDALQKNKNIYGIIRGSSINNDGISFGKIAPSPKGQYEVLLQAYADANLLPEEISYVEAHGTGTTIGDPIEVNVLSKLLTQNHQQNTSDDSNKIALGSVKSNIGHLLPAAGAAGLAKVLLCFKHQTLVPNLNINNINPSLKLDSSPLYVVQQVEPWEQKNGKTRKAGISSFGFGGTNVHVILEEWPDIKTTNALNKEFHLLTLSAKTANALEKITEQTKTLLQTSDVEVNNLCYTRNRFRKHYHHRNVLLLSNNKKIILQITHSTINTQNKPKKALIVLKTAIRPNNNPYNWHAILNHLKTLAVNAIDIVSLSENNRLLQLFPDKQHNELVATDCKHDLFLILDNDKEEIGISSKNLFPEEKILTLKIENSEINEKALLHLVGCLYVNGINFNWDQLHPDSSGKLISLPGYPFEEKSFWVNHLQ